MIPIKLPTVGCALWSAVMAILRILPPRQVIFAGDGGAIAVPSSIVNENVSYCVDGTAPSTTLSEPNRHTLWARDRLHSNTDQSVSVIVSNSVLIRNTAQCNSGIACSGGAIAMSQSGSLQLSNSTAVDNNSSSYGGSVYLGNAPFRCSVDTFVLSGSNISGQTRSTNLSGLYDVCDGSVFVVDSTVDVEAAGSNAECLQCPFGGLCTPTSVIAQPGYWGAYKEQGYVNFTLCPSGYCCADALSCTAMDSCFGNRTGPLCGDCRPGFSESIDSTACVPTSQCASDVPFVWPLAVVGIFIGAFLQLVLVSNLMSGVRRSCRHGFRCVTRACIRTVKSIRASCCQRDLDGNEPAATDRLLEPVSGSAQPKAVKKASTGDARFKVFSYFIQVGCTCGTLLMFSSLAFLLLCRCPRTPPCPSRPHCLHG